MLANLLQNENSNMLYVVRGAELKEFALDIINEVLTKNTEKTKETLHSIDEVSKKFGVDRSTLWRWAKNGYLTPIRVGGKPRYKESDLTRLLEGGRK